MLLLVNILKMGLTLFDFRPQIFISKSYDATTHFETTCDDVLGLFKRITGEDFDFSKVKHTDIETVGGD